MNNVFTNIVLINKKHKYKFVYIVLFALALSSIIYSLYLFWNIYPSGSACNGQSNLGQYLSGTVGVFLSFAGIIAIFIAFIAQRQQIITQREEIKENEYNSRITSFENKFFNLLNTYENIVNHTDYSIPRSIINNEGLIIGTNYEIIKGRRAIKYYYSDFCREYLKRYKNNLKTNLNLDNRRIAFNEVYVDFLSGNQHIFGHYFRTVYHILKLIYVNKDIFGKQKETYLSDKFYSNILRAQLSSPELLLIFFNGLTNIALYESGKLNYKKLAEEYSLFEHLSPANSSNIYDNEERDPVLNLLELYFENAYGDNYESIIQLFTASTYKQNNPGNENFSII